MASQKARRPPSVDCSSRPTGRRANKRRFVNLLQQLGRASHRFVLLYAEGEARCCADSNQRVMRAFELMWYPSSFGPSPLSSHVNCSVPEPFSNCVLYESEIWAPAGVTLTFQLCDSVVFTAPSFRRTAAMNWSYSSFFEADRNSLAASL